MSMTAEEIVSYVESLCYKPGWEFHTDISPDSTSTVFVSIHWHVRDTDRTNAPNYERPLRHPFTTTCSICPSEPLTREHIARRILEYAINLEAGSLYHEGREFLRERVTGERTYNLETDGGGWYAIGTGWNAPFHPHTPLGDDLWYATHSERICSNRFLLGSVEDS